MGLPRRETERVRGVRAAEYAPHAGFKLFFRWDSPVLTPEEIQALPKPPDLIIYQ